MKRHGYDYMMMSPRPDQIPKLNDLDMITGGTGLWFYEGKPQRLLRDYRERPVEWLVPRKRLNSAGIRNSVEIDRALGYTNLTFFTILYGRMTRKDRKGNVTGPPDLAVDREAMSKCGTLWGAYHALREDKLGSLEKDKWADLTVIDKDYLTVPLDEIPKLRVLVTIAGWKIVHLVPSLSRELGMQPVGAQVELGGSATQW